MPMKRKAGSWPSSQLKRQKSTRRRIRRRRKPTGRRGRKVLYTKIMRQPVPDKIYTQLRYSELVKLAPSFSDPGNIATYADAKYCFQTSLYDPNKTGSGHQPLWLDQLAPMYEKYRIHGMKYRLMLSKDSNGDGMIHMLFQQSNKEPESVSNQSQFHTIRERRNTKTLTLNSWTNNVRQHKGFLRTGTPWGLTKREMDADEDFEALMGWDPNKMSYLNIYARTEAGTPKIYIQVNLTYYVELFSRKNVDGS